MPLGANIKCLGKSTAVLKTITNAISRVAGAFTGNVQITATGHGFTVGQYVVISGITGTVEANGRHRVVEVVDADNFVIDVVFAVAYVAGGLVSAPGDLLGNYTALRTPEAPGVWTDRANTISVQALPDNTGNVYVGVLGIDRTTLLGVVAGGILQPGQTLPVGLIQAPNAFKVTEIYWDADNDGDSVIASYMPV